MTQKGRELNAVKVIFDPVQNSLWEIIVDFARAFRETSAAIRAHHTMQGLACFNFAHVRALPFKIIEPCILMDGKPVT